VLQVLDAEAVRRWCTAACEDLAAARHELDGINVYPVPDGDTGTNLLMTLEAVRRRLDEQRREPGAHPDRIDAAADGSQASAAVCVAGPVETSEGECRRTGEALQQAALLGARGNSGVIVSQLLRGVAEQLTADPPCDAAGLQRALTRGASLAYAAVSAPVEGTVLTVARESAEAAAASRGDLATVLRAAVQAAGRSLARTPELLPALKSAGVVDAGGRGWCVLLAALERVVTGGSSAPLPRLGAAAPVTTSVDQQHEQAPHGPLQDDGYTYEVQYLLRDTGELQVRRLTATLEALGDSVVVVGGGEHGEDGRGGAYNVHVHVDDVGAALEAGLDAGRPFRITVVRFADQAGATGHGGDGLASTVSDAQPAPVVCGRAVVAVATGAGLHALLTSCGACVVEGAPGRPPTAERLLEAVLATGSSEVVLLPDDGDAAFAAASAAATARGQGRTVAVVPTRSVLQGLSALAVADPDRPFADDIASMAEAAGSTRVAQTLIASGPAATSVGLCRAGDVLGVLDDDVALIGDDVETVAGELLTRLLAGGGELVTLVRGAGLDPQVVGRLRGQVEAHHRAVEVVDYDGGQAHAPLLLAVE